jgi:hypothetical protein
MIAQSFSPNSARDGRQIRTKSWSLEVSKSSIELSLKKTKNLLYLGRTRTRERFSPGHPPISYNASALIAYNASNTLVHFSN